jgi:signal transduction histidine kinase
MAEDATPVWEGMWTMVEATDNARHMDFGAPGSLCATTSRRRAANVIEFPVRERRDERLEHDLLHALATAEDLASGMRQVVKRIRRGSRAARIEWWAIDEAGTFRPVTASGTGDGDRHEVVLEPVGALVVYDDRLDPRIEETLHSLAPLIRRRAAEERLTRTAIQLAQRNEALEDFAALVAHELKSPLQAALLAGDPSRLVEDALGLVDTLLEAARDEPRDGTAACVAECLDDAAAYLGADLAITAHVAATLPLPARALQVILRNLLANAAAADARHVHVQTVRTPRSCRLVVEDDGVGLDDAGYASGSGLGLSLIRRLAARFGGVVELTARPGGGARATLEFAGTCA